MPVSMLQQGDGAIHGRQGVYIIQARSVYRQHNGDGGPLCTKIDASAERPARLGREADPPQVTDGRRDAVLRSVVFQQVSGQPGNTWHRSRGLIWGNRLPSARPDG